MNQSASNRREQIRAQLPFVVRTTHFEEWGQKYEGKVRDTYTKEELRLLVTSDRLSCFDRVVSAIPFKGQLLNRLALYWFDETSDIIANHLIQPVGPQAVLAKNLSIVPIEVVVRGYLTGSAWRDYEAGNSISGISLPSGLSNYQKLDSPILTPSTKAAKGEHDEPISEQELVDQGIVAEDLWQKIREAALALFARGQAVVSSRGLILVDTKYEFGLDSDGQLVLADEVHTMDCSRYWIAEDYERALAEGRSPKMLDKEPTRQWLLSQGFAGDGPIPEFTEEHRLDIAQHYIESYELITGAEVTLQGGAIEPEIEAVLREYR